MLIAVVSGTCDHAKAWLPCYTMRALWLQHSVTLVWGVIAPELCAMQAPALTKGQHSFIKIFLKIRSLLGALRSDQSDSKCLKRVGSKVAQRRSHNAL